jgi:hypothetical protein
LGVGKEMRIKAGRYTLGLTMVLVGITTFLNSILGRDVLGHLWNYAPAVLILFGLEVIILNLIYSRRENIKVEISGGSLILMIFVIAFFMITTNRMDIQQPFIQGMVRM